MAADASALLFRPGHGSHSSLRVVTVRLGYIELVGCCAKHGSALNVCPL